jgi:hypothetical protein
MNFKKAPAGLFTYKDKNYIKVNSQDDVVVDVAAGKFILDEFEGDEEVSLKDVKRTFLAVFEEPSQKMRFCDMPDGAFFVFCFKYTNERRLFMKVDDWFAVDIITGDYQFDFSCETFVKRFP